MTIVQSLQSLSGYPVPATFITNALAANGIEDGSASITQDIRSSVAYRRATAGVYRFLSTAPNVSQGGISYSLSNEDKAEYKRMAREEMKAIDAESVSQYGYKGDNY